MGDHWKQFARRRFLLCHSIREMSLHVFFCSTTSCRSNPSMLLVCPGCGMLLLTDGVFSLYLLCQWVTWAEFLHMQAVVTKQQRLYHDNLDSLQVACLFLRFFWNSLLI